MAKKDSQKLFADEVNNIVRVEPKDISIQDRLREVNPKKVQALVESIENSGQLQPIIIDTMGILIAGAHRLEACKQLGIQVEARVLDVESIEHAELIEIDENLIRSELTPREIEKQLVRRKALYLQLYPETAKGGVANDTGKKSFVEDASEKTGKSKRTIERAIKRGAEADSEVLDARDSGKITTSDVDEIIAGSPDAETQKELLKAKLEQKKDPKPPKTEKPKTYEQGLKEANSKWKKLVGTLIPEDVSKLAVKDCRKILADIQGACK